MMLTHCGNNVRNRYSGCVFSVKDIVPVPLKTSRNHKCEIRANRINWGKKKGNAMNWYLEVFKKYTVVSGRARRKEYWMFVLFNIIIAIAIGFVEGLVGSPGIIGMIYCLAVLVPSVAVSVRRLHDTGRSGWWVLVAFVPLIGAIVLIVFMVLDGQEDENEYGPNPKSAAE